MENAVFAQYQLLFAATPIGNHLDASPRLCAALAEADLICAEDTRRAGLLAQRLGVSPRGRYLPLHEHNEAGQAERVVRACLEGERVLVISDAGMPGVSDPGFRLLGALREAGVRYSLLPGPSAVLSALLLSGLPSDSFSFLGFAPRKSGELERFIQLLAAQPHTTVFFDSPRRALKTIEAIARALPERELALCRELTKTHEEVLRLPAAELYRVLSERGELRGEIALVLAPAPSPASPSGTPVSAGSVELGVLSERVLAERVLELNRAGLRLKQASALVGSWFGLKPSLLYQAALEAKPEGD